MFVSDLIKSLESFKSQFGDREVEFWVRDDIDEDSIEAELDEIHDGYNGIDNGIETVCEIRVSIIDA